MFGITSAPDKYQQVIQKVLKCCSGTANISDDIIIYHSMVLTELNMKATGESAHKIEGQGPFSYQGEIYNLFAKVHIYWLGTMTTYKTLVQRKRKSKH